jgi:class 3 adenylate cyclase
VANSVLPVENQQKIERAIEALEAQRAILGDEVVEIAIASLRQKLREINGRAASQRKQVTVLFADLVNFTALTGAMDAEDVVELINTLWERLDNLILAHGGNHRQTCG